MRGKFIWDIKTYQIQRVVNKKIIVELKVNLRSYLC